MIFYFHIQSNHLNYAVLLIPIAAALPKFGIKEGKTLQKQAKSLEISNYIRREPPSRSVNFGSPWP